MPNNDKIVITGMGVLSSLGIGIEPFWDGLIEGKCGIGRVTQFPVESDLYPCKIAAEVPEFVPVQTGLSADSRPQSRYMNLTLTSLDMAIRDAGLINQAEMLRSAALFIGSAGQTGGVIEQLIASWVQEKPPAILADTISQIDPFSALTTASQIYGIRNKTMNINSSCSAGVFALMICAEYLRAGKSEIGLMVGADTMSPLLFMGAGLTGELSRRNEDPVHACRPFDRDQDGWVVGEGAVAIVLETEAHALSRGANIYAELGHFAPTTDGSSFKYVDPNGTQLARGYAAILDQIPASQIDYVNAHALAIATFDRAESLAIRRAFGKHADYVPVTSIKGATGNPSGVGGMLQVVSAILSIRDGIIPHTLNLENPLPDCDLNYVKNVPRYQKIGTVLVSAHGGGGLNVAFTVHKFSQ